MFSIAWIVWKTLKLTNKEKIERIHRKEGKYSRIIGTLTVNCFFYLTEFLPCFFQVWVIPSRRGEGHFWQNYLPLYALVIHGTETSFKYFFIFLFYFRCCVMSLSTASLVYTYSCGSFFAIYHRVLFVCQPRDL